jgi:hypothetical protein
MRWKRPRHESPIFDENGRRFFMKNCFGILLLLSVSLAAPSAENPLPDVVQETYNGLSGCLAMRGGDCKLVIAPSIGGRVLNFSLNGENILFDNPEAKGRTLLNSGNFWAGGYQLDVGPELRGMPEHRWLFQGPWNWRIPRPYAVHTFSEPERALGVQLEKEFVIDPDTGELGLTQRMRNILTNDISFCLWDRTLCKGGGFAMFPLNRNSRFKAGWSIRQGKAAPGYRYDGDKPADERVRIMDGILVVQARALPTGDLKIGADSEAGWIAYALGRILFVKYFPVFATGNYTDGGNTVEFYCSDKVAELEPLSPEVTLKPTGTYSFPEKWLLVELEQEVKSYEQARALVKRIPRSPFAK